MAIITAEGLAIPGAGPVFNGNGSALTLKKISETDWLLFGDVAEGKSTGFSIFPGGDLGDILYRKDNGVTIAVLDGIAPVNGWAVFEGEDYYVVKDSGTLRSVVGIFKDLDGNGEIFIDADGKQLSLNRVVTTFVTGMGGLFGEASVFNQDIGTWDVSNVTNTEGMFSRASAFNQDIGSWDVSSVTRMVYMFSRASAFNQDIRSWDVRSVTEMGYMFNIASAFNQDLSPWCVPLISSKPKGFDTNTTAWVKTNRQPIWGTCPSA